MTVDSGDKLWQLNSDRPFEDILGPPEVLREIRSYLFFEPLPFVNRVVFLATPHRGSDMSRGLVGRVGTNLISEPDQVSTLLAQLVKDNPDAFPRRFRRLPTSIETLEPDSPILEALLEMKPGPGVIFHSIIGSNRPRRQPTTTDGIVPYQSAHLEGVASERSCPSDHSVQKDPEAIREVRRILREHLKGVDLERRLPRRPPRAWPLRPSASETGAEIGFVSRRRSLASIGAGHDDREPGSRALPPVTRFSPTTRTIVGSFGAGTNWVRSVISLTYPSRVRLTRFRIVKVQVRRTAFSPQHRDQPAVPTDDRGGSTTGSPLRPSSPEFSKHLGFRPPRLAGFTRRLLRPSRLLCEEAATSLLRLKSQPSNAE